MLDITPIPIANTPPPFRVRGLNKGCTISKDPRVDCTPDLTVQKCPMGTPWDTMSSSNSNISATNRSYPKSFRIWSFQTNSNIGFQGFCLKPSQLGEIFVQSWNLVENLAFWLTFLSKFLYPVSALLNPGCFKYFGVGTHPPHTLHLLHQGQISDPGLQII